MNHLQTALNLHQNGRLAEAESHYRRARVASPGSLDVIRLGGICLMQLGRHEEAEKWLKAGGRDPQILASLALVKHEQGNFEAAVQLYRDSVKKSDAQPEAWFNLGNSLVQLKQFEEAELAYRRAAELQPDWADAWENLAGALMDLGKNEAAWESMQKSLTLAPKNPRALNTAANISYRLNRRAESVQLCEAALALDPNYALAWCSLGVVLEAKKDPSAAAQAFQKAIELRPDLAEPHAGLALCLRQAKNYDRAVAHVCEALRLKPDCGEAVAGLGYIHMDLGMGEAAVEDLRTAAGLIKADYSLQSSILMGLLYCDSASPIEVKEEAKAIAATLPPADFCAWNPEPNRIDFLSGDLHLHPVGFFLAPLLRELKAMGWKTAVWSIDPRRDAQTDLLQSHASEWREIWTKTDQDGAAEIHQSGASILIDLGGHTSGGCPNILSRRPAPVQVSWLGWSATTGLEAMDGILVDSILCPVGDEEQYTERVLRLRDSFLCFEPEADAMVEPGQMEPEKIIGCFNNPAKISPRILHLWGRILQAKPEFKLALKHKASASQHFQNRVAAELAPLGIAPDRVGFWSYLSREEHWTSFDRVSVLLDPAPYGGATSTIDALWMGTPVVTLRGNSYVGRMSSSLLAVAGRSDWVAESEAEYIEKVIALSSDRGSRAERRAEFLQSPLCDSRRFALSFIEQVGQLGQKKRAA